MQFQSFFFILSKNAVIKQIVLRLNKSITIYGDLSPRFRLVSKVSQKL